MMLQPDSRSRRRRHRPYEFLLLLLLMLATIVCSGQISLAMVRPDRIDLLVEPLKTADYSRWEQDEFKPVDPALGTLAAIEWVKNLTEAPALLMLPTYDRTAFPLPTESPTPDSLSGTAPPQDTAIAGESSPAPDEQTDLPESTRTVEAAATQTRIAALATASPTLEPTAAILTLTAARPSITPTGPRPSITPTGTRPSITPTGTRPTVTPTVTPTGTRLTATGTLPTATGTLPTATVTGTPPTATPTSSLPAPPVANFTASPTLGAAPLVVSLNNLSTGDITTYWWTFGDGVGTSTLAAPGPYRYDFPGTYLITLEVTGPGGTDTATALIVVMAVSPTPTYSQTPSFTPWPTFTFTPTYTPTATLTGTHSPTPTFTPSPTPTHTVTPSLTPVMDADLEMFKTVSNPAPLVGSSVRFTVTIVNNGPLPASGVQVTDLLPAGLTFVMSDPGQGSYTSASGLWDVGALANGANAALDLYAVVNAGTAGMTLTNTASVSASSQPDPNLSNNSASAAVVPVSGGSLADLSLTKTVDIPTPSVGGTILYSLTLSNSGPAAASGIQVTDLLPAGVTYQTSFGGGTYDSVTGIWSVAALSTGGSTTVNIRVSINNGTEGALITNTALISYAAQGDPDPSNNADSVSVTVRSAGLRMQKTVSVPNPIVGQTITYTLQVTNLMTMTATGVQVTDVLPVELAFVSAATGYGSYNPATGLWDVGSIGAGATASLTITVTVGPAAAGRTITNMATITAMDQPDSNPGDNSASRNITVPTADLAVIKTVSTGAPPEGSTITYTVRLINNMPVPDSGVQVTDLLPAGLTFVSATPGQGTYDSVTGLWDIGAVSSGATITLLLRASVDAGTAGTTITNTATITAATQPDSNPANNSASRNITVVTADLGLTKTVGPPIADVGDNVTFTVRLTNNMPVADTGVQVTDVLPAGLTFVSATPSQGTYDSVSGLWNVGTVGAGVTLQLPIVANVDASASGTTVVNTATITAATQPDPNPANNTASATLTVTLSNVNLAVTKAVSNPTPGEGQLITYTVDVRNNGTSRATGVEITDVLPAEITVVNTTVTRGSYNSGTGLWTIGNLNAGATGRLTALVIVNAGTAGLTVNNTATVTALVQPDTDPSNNSASVTFHVPGTDLAVSKSVDVVVPDEGDPIVYTLVATNNGPDAVAAFQITDQLPLGVTYVAHGAGQGTYDPVSGLWDIGALAPLASTTLTINATVNMGTGGGVITNTGSITLFALPDLNLANNSASATVTVTIPATDLTLNKVASDPAPAETESVTFTITLTNAGPNDATGVQVMDLLPAGLTFSGASVSQGSYNPGTGVWDVGGVLNLATAQLQITALVNIGTGGTAISNVAAISAADQPDPNAPNNSASAALLVDPAANLEINPLCSANPPLLRSWRVRNANLYPITFDWQILGSGQSGTNVVPARVGATPGEVLFDTVTELEPNTLQVSVGGVPHDAENGDATPCVSVDLSVAKSVDLPTPNEGETILYTITVTNGGPNDASSVLVMDLLPGGLTFAGITGISQGSYDPGTGQWAVGGLLTSASATLQLSVTVNAGTAGSTITNTTSAAGAEYDPNTGNNSAGVGITVNLPPTAADDTASTPVDTPVVVGVLANDSDPEGSLDPGSVAIASPPTNGIITDIDVVTGAITYQPNPAYTGPDSFTYQVCDTRLLCDTATVSVSVP